MIQQPSTEIQREYIEGLQADIQADLTHRAELLASEGVNLEELTLVHVGTFHSNFYINSPYDIFALVDLEDNEKYDPENLETREMVSIFAFNENSTGTNAIETINGHSFRYMTLAGSAKIALPVIYSSEDLYRDSLKKVPSNVPHTIMSLQANTIVLGIMNSPIGKLHPFRAIDLVPADREKIDPYHLYTERAVPIAEIRAMRSAIREEI